MSEKIATLKELSKFANYSFVNTLSRDTEAREDGVDHEPREVFSGHYILVNPTPIENPHYIAHSETFFDELGFDDTLAHSEDFMKMFSGDTSELPEGLKKVGWATGYALSIYGTEYYEQCPFQSGNGYGDGRAISILELLIDSKRWETQLKGGGRTPYCRGADGRAVLRSSVREFLAQEHMHALGVPTSRSLTLYASNMEKVRRPWFLNGSYSRNPEVMIEEKVAITTRVASSFLRVGQLELFGRRARKNEHPNALKELEEIFLHLIDREYKEAVDENLSIQEKALVVAYEFRKRLASLVANWIRVGYCQGNFNSDNCAAGGFTLDYGPFGFIEEFSQRYQPWTGGGAHFSFLNQPQAAEQNFHMFYTALLPLFQSHERELKKLNEIRDGFSEVMELAMREMWTQKLGLGVFNASLVNELFMLLQSTPADYTIFFRELSNIPNEVSELEKSFYAKGDENLLNAWQRWLEKWRNHLPITNEESRQNISQKMKLTNPKYTLREWFLVEAYEKAQSGDYSVLKELQAVMQKPYDEQSDEVEAKYYRKKPRELFSVAGVSHISCSS